MPAREWPPVVPTMPGPGDDDAVAVPVTVTDATPSPPAVPATKPLPTPKPPVAAPVAMPDPAKPPAPSPASVASTPVEDAAPVTERPMATEAATSEGELPAWAASGVKVVDLAMAGNLAGAALAAKPLPSEFGDAVAALQAARAALPRLYVAQQAALVAARPRLPVMPNLPDMALVGCIDKGVKFAAGEHAGTTVPWDRLGREDHAALRAALPTAGLTGEQQRLLARVTLDATNLATADASDPVVAAFQHLARLKAELASAAQRERDAARRREALLGELAADWKALDPRAQRLLGNLATVTTGEPMVISGPIDRRIELRGFVVIRADATMVAGGELIPCPGALVLNGSPKANYEATQVEGDAFVSCSVHAGQTFFHHGFERGRVMANAVFYGSVLIDPVHSPRFRDCAFIGGTGPRDVVSWEKSVQRDGQVLHCDFHRLRLLNALAIAASDKCAYSACELVGSPSEIKPRDICAWDPKGVLQAQLDARGVPVRVHPQGGREQTMLGPDVAAVAKALDKVVAVWGPKALGW